MRKQGVGRGVGAGGSERAGAAGRRRLAMWGARQRHGRGMGPGCLGGGLCAEQGAWGTAAANLCGGRGVFDAPGPEAWGLVRDPAGTSVHWAARGDVLAAPASAPGPAPGPAHGFSALPRAAESVGLGPGWGPLAPQRGALTPKVTAGSPGVGLANRTGDPAEPSPAPHLPRPWRHWRS